MTTTTEQSITFTPPELAAAAANLSPGTRIELERNLYAQRCVTLQAEVDRLTEENRQLLEQLADVPSKTG